MQGENLLSGRCVAHLAAHDQQRIVRLREKQPQQQSAETNRVSMNCRESLNKAAGAHLRTRFEAGRLHFLKDRERLIQPPRLDIHPVVEATQKKPAISKRGGGATKRSSTSKGKRVINQATGCEPVSTTIKHAHESKNWDGIHPASEPGRNCAYVSSTLCVW